MLGHVNWLAGQQITRDLCRKHHLGVDTWLAITINDIIDADNHTGRGMATTQQTAAARVQRSTATVQHARKVSVRLGICVEYYRGRELSRKERLTLVHAQPGATQRGFANVYAYGVMPARLRSRIHTPRPGRYARFYLPKGGSVSELIDLFEPQPIMGAGAPRQEKRPRRRHPGLALGWELVAHPGVRFLDSVPPVRFARLLAGHSTGGWQGLALGDALIDVARDLGVDLELGKRNPCGLLKVLLGGVEMIPFHPPAPAVACGRSICDHGWIELEPGLVRKCELCPPSIRASLPPVETFQAPTWWDEQDCPF